MAHFYSEQETRKKLTVLETNDILCITIYRIT